MPLGEELENLWNYPLVSVHFDMLLNNITEFGTVYLQV